MSMTLFLASLILAERAVAPSPPARFSVQRESGRWLLKTPENKPFWSFGVDCVATGESKKTYNPANPAYRSWALFPNDAAWGIDSLQKLRAWGFNSLGGWSDVETLRKAAPKQLLPYTVVLHLGSYYRAPFDDLFSEAAAKAIDKAAQDQILPIKNDPQLIGYFSDNELGWWDDTLFLAYLQKLPLGSAGRTRTHQMLQKMYGAFENFRKEWNTSATDWDSFAKKPDLSLKSGTRGIRAVNAFMAMIGDHYYRLMRDSIRRYDRTHLILGDRYCQYYNAEIARASKPYIDVASTNFGADWTDGTFSPFFLEALHVLTAKPVMITEFYMCATENRSGNKNSSAGFPVVPTQAERAAAFRRNVEGFARVPFVVGAHWFQMHDEPTHGRGDGENFNMGLIDIHGVPYEGMIQAAKAIDFKKLLSAPYARPAASKIPSVAFDPMLKPNLKAWPRSEGRVLPASKEPFADLYVAQDKEAIYLGLYAMEYSDESIYPNFRMPESERPRLQLRLGQSLSLDIRFGGNAGKGKPVAATINDQRVTLIEKPDLKHTVILRVPRSILNLAATEKISISGQLESHSRGRTMSWKALLRQ